MQKMKLERLPDWEDRLTAYIQTIADTPFEWGWNDCLMFVAGAIDAVTGQDPADEHRGQYRSQTGAVRYLKKLGFDSPEACLDALFERVPAAFARRGDVVLAEDCAGLCMGNLALFLGENNGGGFERLALDQWQAAWKIG
jgi:hypothetical protein